MVATGVAAVDAIVVAITDVTIDAIAVTAVIIATTNVMIAMIVKKKTADISAVANKEYPAAKQGIYRH